MKTGFVLICASVIGIAALMTTNSTAQIDPANALGIYLMDEGEGNTIGDSSGNGSDGKLMNDPQWVDGKFGKALKFDGLTTVVELNNPMNVGDFGTSHSISVWANLAAEQNGNADMLGNHGQPGGYEIEQRGEEHNKFYFGMKINDAWQGGPWAERPSTQLVDGVWEHLVVIREGDTVKHYLNGDQTVEYGVDPERVEDTTDSNFLIGNSACCGEGRTITGTLDEVAIFTVALTEADVTALAGGLMNATSVDSAGKMTTTWGQLKSQYK